MKRFFGSKPSMVEMLDATGYEWSMHSTPRKESTRYEVKVNGAAGIGATFDEAAEKAMQNAGLLKKFRYPRAHSRLDDLPLSTPFRDISLFPIHRRMEEGET